MVENRTAKQVIQAVLEEIFGDARIGDVHVALDYDKDGDEVLRVKVVFDGTQEQFDARKATSVVRHMRPRLAAVGQQAFPIISYVSKDEMGGVKDAVG